MYNLTKFPRQYLPERVCRVFGWRFGSEYRYGKDGLSILIVERTRGKAEWRTLSYARICVLFHWKRITSVGTDYVHLEHLSDVEKARFLGEPIIKGVPARAYANVSTAASVAA